MGVLVSGLFKRVCGSLGTSRAEKHALSFASPARGSPSLLLLPTVSYLSLFLCLSRLPLRFSQVRSSYVSHLGCTQRARTRDAKPWYFRRDKTIFSIEILRGEKKFYQERGWNSISICIRCFSIYDIFLKTLNGAFDCFYNEINFTEKKRWYTT